MKYSTILFDADGVTIHSEMMFSEVLARDYDIPLETMLPFFKGPFQECMFGRADLKEELGKVVDDWGWSKPVDKLLEEWFAFEDKPDEEMFDLIKRLRNQDVKCYLATNQEGYRGNYLRDEMKFDQAFDGLFISAELGYKKKDTRFFEKAFEVINETDRSKVLFVDNEEENTESASEFGFDSHLFTTLESFLPIIE